VLANIRAVMFAAWTFTLAIPLFVTMLALALPVMAFDKFRCDAGPVDLQHGGGGGQGAGSMNTQFLWYMWHQQRHQWSHFSHHAWATQLVVEPWSGRTSAHVCVNRTGEADMRTYVEAVELQGECLDVLSMQLLMGPPPSMLC
jgi:hypothetical protein